jgi:serine/threonine protein kinase/tetratricopeptide (TPR) repeat protein
VSSESTTRIGPYVITREIGRGGMGVVHLARDEKLGREVAIKCLPDELVDDERRLARLDREARLLASLNHPHIATIHGLEERDGRRYLVLEYLDGETLEAFSQRQRSSWRKCVEVAASIADALAAAHARGVVHRDIKPDNVRFTRDGIVKVLDFGLASDGAAEPDVADAGDPDRSGHHDQTVIVTRDTLPGAVLGTPGYMAPEQARGERADARSDIFSFGCLLYELLTREPIFVRDSVASSMSATLTEEPEVPSLSGAQIPDELDAIVMRCLEKRPDDRFQSAKDLAFALRSLLAPSGTRERAAMKRAPGRARLIGSIVLVLALVSVGAWLARRDGDTASSGIETKTPDLPRLAVFQFESADALAHKAYLAREIPSIIIDGLSTLAGLHVVPRSTTFRHSVSESDIMELGSQLEADAILTGRIEAREGTLYVRAELLDVVTRGTRWSRRFDESIDDTLAIEQEMTRSIVQALELQITGEEQRRLASRRPVSSEAHRAYLEGRFEAFQRNAPALRRAIELYDRAIQTDPTFALAYAGKADAYCLLALGLAAPATQLMPRAEAAAEKALEHGDGLAEVHAARGFIHWLWDWQYDRAAAEYERAIELNSKYAEARHFYAHVLCSQGRYAEAVTQGEEARRLEPDKLVFNSCLGHYYSWSGQKPRALEQLRKTLEMDDRFGLARVYLGRELVAQERADEGVEVLLQMVEERQRVGDGVGDLGWAYAEAGRLQEAREHLEMVRALSNAEYIPHVAFARIYAGMGDTDRVVESLWAAVEQRESVLPLIRSEPHFRNLHEDPRFIEILREIGLAP